MTVYVRRADTMSLHEFTRKYFGALLAKEGRIPGTVLDKARTLKFHVATLQGRPLPGQAANSMRMLQKFMCENSGPQVRHSHCAALVMVGHVVSAFEDRRRPAPTI